MQQPRQKRHLLGAILAGRRRHVGALIPTERRFDRLKQRRLASKRTEFVEYLQSGHNRRYGTNKRRVPRRLSRSYKISRIWPATRSAYRRSTNTRSGSPMVITGRLSG